MDNSMKEKGADLSAMLPKHNRRKVYIIIIVLVLLAGWWFYVKMTSGPNLTPEQVKQQIIDQVNNGPSGSIIPETAKQSVMKKVEQTSAQNNNLTDKQKQDIINRINGQEATQ
jgi:hypothetical protein